MNKVLYLMLLFLNFNILFGDILFDREVYNVGMDDTCRDPELLVSPDGDMFFFYIKDNKLQIEKKTNDSYDFTLIENNFLNVEVNVKSIKRFRISDETYSLVVLASFNGEDSLYILSFDGNNLITVHDSRIDNNYSGNITNYKLHAVGYKEFILSYLKDSILHYSYVNRSEIIHKTISDNEVSDYGLYEAIQNDKLVLKGYLLNVNNTLFNIKVDKKDKYVTYITEYDSDSDLTVDHYLNISESETYIYSSSKNRVYESCVGSTISTNITDSINNYYLTYSDKPKLNFYSYENRVILLKNEDVRDVKKYKIMYDELYYLTFNDELFFMDLSATSNNKLIDTSVTDFYIFNENYNTFAITQKIDDEKFNLIQRDGDSFSLVKEISNTDNEYGFNNSSLDQCFKNLIYETGNEIIQVYESKYIVKDTNDNTQVLLTKSNNNIQLEVIK